jgi:hypothetical protein
VLHSVACLAAITARSLGLSDAWPDQLTSCQ